MAVTFGRRPHTIVWITVWSFVVVLSLMFGERASAAEGFRIETKVFSGKEKTPVSETTTLFRDGVVYDFIKKPQQTAVFRRPTGNAPGRFILLSDSRSIRTQVLTEKLAGLMTKMRDWDARQRDPFLQFAANPEFEETFDESEGKLILASHLETYTVTTSTTDHSEALAEYKEFLDWYTRLNALQSGGKVQPEPRLRLNAALARHQVVPQTVQLQRAGEDPLRAEHTFTWRLSKEDDKRIDSVQVALSSYKEVENDEFLRLTQPK
jgi:hypothetical protein